MATFDENKINKRELVVQMTNIEMKISQAQENINTFNKQIEAADKAQGNAGLMVLLGLFLAPVGIGIIILIAAFIAMITTPRKVKKLKAKRNEWLNYLNGLRKKLAYIRGELAII